MRGKLFLLSNSTPIIGAVVTTTLLAADPSGVTTSTLTLADNGTNGDAVANDGEYTALLPSGLVSQTLQAQVYARGSHAGNDFTRTEVVLGRARSGELTFNGPYSWQTNAGQTENASSNIDTVIFKAGVNVQQAGNYRVEATLVGADGKVVSNATSNNVFEAGTNTVQLRFDGKQVGEAGGNGPYRIAALTAYRIVGTGSNETDRLANPSSLPPLNITSNQLKRDAFALKALLLTVPLSQMATVNSVSCA